MCGHLHIIKIDGNTTHERRCFIWLQNQQIYMQGLWLMIYEVEVSEQADSDLRGIFEYIAFELQSPENASGQLDRLEEQILSLDTMPERYRKYEKEPWKSRGLRVLPVDNYVVLYIPDSDKKVVTILRVMYAGRDIDNQLNLHTKQ